MAAITSHMIVGSAMAEFIAATIESGIESHNVPHSEPNPALVKAAETFREELLEIASHGCDVQITLERHEDEE